VAEFSIIINRSDTEIMFKTCMISLLIQIYKNSYKLDTKYIFILIIII